MARSHMPEGVPDSNCWTTSSDRGMQGNVPGARSKRWAGSEREFLDQILIHDGKEAPEFVLLDMRGPSAGALLAAVACLSALLVATAFLSNHRSAARSPLTGVFTTITIAHPAL